MDIHVFMIDLENLYFNYSKSRDNNWKIFSKSTKIIFVHCNVIIASVFVTFLVEMASHFEVICLSDKNFTVPFFLLGIFFTSHSQVTEHQGKVEDNYNSSPLFPSLHKHLDISRAVTAESSPLCIGSNWNRTGNLSFPTTSH